MEAADPPHLAAGLLVAHGVVDAVGLPPVEWTSAPSGARNDAHSRRLDGRTSRAPASRSRRTSAAVRAVSAAADTSNGTDSPTARATASSRSSSSNGLGRTAANAASWLRALRCSAASSAAPASAESITTGTWRLRPLSQAASPHEVP